MREMSSLLRHKRRHRSSSCSSPDNSRKVSHKVSNHENSVMKHGKEAVRRKCPHKVQSEDLSDSSSGHDERNLGKKRKKHSHHRKIHSRDSESGEENIEVSKRKTSQSYRDSDRQRSKVEEDRNRPREKENSRCNHKKEQYLSSEYKSSDHTRRRERRYENDGVHRRDGGGGSRQSDKRFDSADCESREHSNDRYQEHRDDGHNRRKHVDENDRRENGKRLHEGEERRKRWNDGGEGSRSGGSKGHGSSEGNQLTNFDRNRPIKQEPGMNNEESENYEWGSKATSGPRAGNDIKKEKDMEKDKPNFGLSGKLTEDTNMVNGVVIKYSEPPEARKPRRRWRLYVFKGDENLPTLYLHRQSAFLIGRDRKVVDIPVDHPSCSKQHAAFQFRLVPYQRPNGTMGKRVRPYIIDLESSNGTFVNNNRIDSKKYVELLERDVMKFGFSSREYVLLHEQSKESDGEDDDVVGA